MTFSAGDAELLKVTVKAWRTVCTILGVRECSCYGDGISEAIPLPLERLNFQQTKTTIRLESV